MKNQQKFYAVQSRSDQKEIVKVETIEGTNMYRLFEHVTVGIQLKGSEAHAHVLNLR